MNSDACRWLLLPAGIVAGYAVVMSTNPARAGLRDGWRCLRRYRQTWLIPMLFAMTHAGFNLWVRFYESRVIPEAPSTLIPWTGWQPPVLTDVTILLRPAGVPAAACRPLTV